jgi:hypothetical protein
MDIYGAQRETLTRGELRAIAASALKTRTLAPSEDFSPAEAFSGLARAIIGYQENGELPQRLETIHPLGPLEMPPSKSETSRVKTEDVFALARAADDHIRQTGALPSSLQVGGAHVGTGSLFALFSAVYLELDSGKPRPEYDVAAFEAYPRTNEKRIVEEIEGYKSWPVHRPDLDMTRIVELTKLQLWTLKPAHRR